MKKIVFCISLLISISYFSSNSFSIDISQQDIQAFQQLSENEKEALKNQYYNKGKLKKSDEQNNKTDNPVVVIPRERRLLQEKINENDKYGTNEINEKKTIVHKDDNTVEEENFEGQDLSIKKENKESTLIEEDNSVFDDIWKSLKPFGYDIFAGAPTTFAPVTEIPVPANYIMGPGDEVEIQIYGNVNHNYSLSVNREGVIQIPEFGPVNVTGMNFDDFHDFIINKIKKGAVGTEINLSLGKLRSIRVFMLGEAYQPGSYTLSSLSTVTNALLVSGGVKGIGSLRNIKLKREGKIISSMDLYDLLLYGNMENDIRLLPGDVIFIPVVGPQIAVDGGIKRPGIYELNNKTKLGDVISLAGGFWNARDIDFLRIYRIDPSGTRLCKIINLRKPGWESFSVKNQDIIIAPKTEEDPKNIVKLSGNVYSPGLYEYSAGLTINDIVKSFTGLKRNTDINYGIVLREKSRFNQYEVITFNPADVLSGKKVFVLEPEDHIFFFPNGLERLDIANEIIEKLESRKSLDGENYFSHVEIFGNVFFPGKYPLGKEDNLKMVLNACGGLRPETRRSFLTVVRKNGLTDKIKVYTLAADDTEFLFNPGDQLYIFAKADNIPVVLEPLIKKLKDQADNEKFSEIVNITGEIRFPGDYPLVKNMKIKDLIDYAGGFLEGSFSKYCDITRYNISEDQTFEIKRSKVYFSADKSEKTLSMTLRENDRIMIKTIPDWRNIPKVKITGEVKFPGEYYVEIDTSLTDLVNMAGGLSDRAFVEGSVFMRESLRKIEQQRYDSYVDQLSAQLGTRRLKEEDRASSQQEKADNALLAIIEKLKNAKASGRLVIDLKSILENKKKDVVLKDGDHLHIPVFKNEVTVMGEVFSPVSHLYEDNMNLFDFIDFSGGVTESASLKRIYIIRASGKVVPYLAGKKGWFAKKNTDVFPGDTIVVPYDITAVSPIVFWGDITKILYQLSTSVAALSAVGVF